MEDLDDPSNPSKLTASTMHMEERAIIGTSKCQKVVMEDSDWQEQGNKIFGTPKSLIRTISLEQIYEHPLQISRDFKNLKKRTAVKDPISERRFKLPKQITFRQRQARLFMKEEGSTQGFVQEVVVPYGKTVIPLGMVHDYNPLHVRCDGWAIFLRESDLSVIVVNVKTINSGNILSTPAIGGMITEGKIFSASLIGEVSRENFEIFMVASGVVNGQQTGALVHLGRQERMWEVTTFPSHIPTKSVGPVFLDEGVLVSIIDGQVLFTLNLHDFSSNVVELVEFEGTRDCSLIKGAGGEVYAVQVSEMENPLGPFLKLERGAGGLGWLMPTVTPLGATVGSWYLPKDDIGFILPGTNGAYTNSMGSRHLCLFSDGAWAEISEEHQECTCTGGFIILD